MRIAVSAMRPNLNSAIDPRFGRCRYLIFVDSDTLDFEPLENPNLMGLGATGTQLAQLAASKGAQALLTGQIGPAAQQVLFEAKIEVYTNVKGTVKEAVDRFRSGAFAPVVPPVPAEMPAASALATASAPAAATAPAPAPAQSAPYQQAPRFELAELRSQLLALSRLLSEIQRRLDEMDKRG